MIFLVLEFFEFNQFYTASNSVIILAVFATPGLEPFNPVCGSDGNTYSNELFLQVGRCQNRHLKIVKNGPCKLRKVVL